MAELTHVTIALHYSLSSEHTTRAIRLSCALNIKQHQEMLPRIPWLRTKTVICFELQCFVCTITFSALIKS